MIVRYWMTPSPKCIPKTMELDIVLMMSNRFGVRRFPVIDADGLCGIISVSDLYRFVAPGHARKIFLSEEEAENLRNHKVKDVMTPEPIVCSPNDTLEKIGLSMQKKRIGALPVVNDGMLVGIITETDVLSAFLNLFHTNLKGARICLRASNNNSAQHFYEIVELCKQHNLNILSLLTQTIDSNAATLMTLRVYGEGLKSLLDSLWVSDFQVLLVE